MRLCFDRWNYMSELASEPGTSTGFVRRTTAEWSSTHVRHCAEAVRIVGDSGVSARTNEWINNNFARLP